jgi:antitoxin component YwqK of YwqJK toxin-antitoxin module
MEPSGSLDLVYKSCEKDWIVSLQPLKDTITNTGRDDVADPQYAKFRGNKFRVVGIEHKHDPSLTTKTVTSSYYDKSLVYKVGEIVAVEDYDMDNNKVYATGIHFFLSKAAAFNYELSPRETQLCGPFTTYQDNGRKAAVVSYKNGRLSGPAIKYHSDVDEAGDDIICAEMTFENSELHGSFTKYHSNGIKYLKTNYVNGQKHGLCTEYTSDGRVSLRTSYVNGHLEHGIDNTAAVFLAVLITLAVLFSIRHLTQYGKI